MWLAPTRGAGSRCFRRLGYDRYPDAYSEAGAAALLAAAEQATAIAWGTSVHDHAYLLGAAFHSALELHLPREAKRPRPSFITAETWCLVLERLRLRRDQKRLSQRAAYAWNPIVCMLSLTLVVDGAALRTA